MAIGDYFMEGITPIRDKSAELFSPIPTAPDLTGTLNYGTPPKEMSVWDRFNAAMSNKNLLNAMMLGGKAANALAYNDPRVRAGELSKLTGQLGSALALAPQPQVQPTTPVQPQVQPTMQPTTMGAPTTPNLTLRNTPVASAIGDTNPSVAPGAPQSAISNGSAGAFPMISLSPMDYLAISGGTYDPNKGTGGFSSALETAKTSAHAGSTEGSVRAAQDTARAHLLAQDLAANMQPYKINETISQAMQHRASAAKQEAETLGTGAFSPEALGRKSQAESKGKETGKLEAERADAVQFASSPGGRAIIPAEVKRLIPTLAPYTSYGQAAINGISLKDISRDVTSRLNTGQLAGAQSLAADRQLRTILAQFYGTQVNQANDRLASIERGYFDPRGMDDGSKQILGLKKPAMPTSVQNEYDTVKKQRDSLIKDYEQFAVGKTPTQDKTPASVRGRRAGEVPADVKNAYPNIEQYKKEGNQELVKLKGETGWRRVIRGE
jgi:hypothetical protein